MDNAELILQELQKINSRLDKMDGRLDGMDSRMDRMERRLDSLEEKVDTLTEEHAITRDGVNTLIAWADRVAVVVKMPLQ